MEDKNDDSAKQTAITATLCIFFTLGVCLCFTCACKRVSGCFQEDVAEMLVV